MLRYSILLLQFVILTMARHINSCENDKDLNCDLAPCPKNKVLDEYSKCVSCHGNNEVINGTCVPCHVGTYQINGTCQPCYDLCRYANNATFIDIIPEYCYNVSYCKKRLKMYIKGRCQPGLVLDLKLGVCDYCAYACDEYDRLNIGHLCDKECIIESCRDGFYKRTYAFGAQNITKPTGRSVYCASCKNLCQLEKDKRIFESEMDCHLREECSELYRDIVTSSCKRNELYDLMSGSCRTCEEMCIFDRQEGMQDICNNLCGSYHSGTKIIIVTVSTIDNKTSLYPIIMAPLIAIPCIGLVVMFIILVVIVKKKIQKRHTTSSCNEENIAYPIEEDEHPPGSDVPSRSLLLNDSTQGFMMYSRNKHDSNHTSVMDLLLNNRPLTGVHSENKVSSYTNQSFREESYNDTTNPNLPKPLHQDNLANPVSTGNQCFDNNERNVDVRDGDSLRQSGVQLSYIAINAFCSKNQSNGHQTLPRPIESLPRNSDSSQQYSLNRNSSHKNAQKQNECVPHTRQTDAPTLDDIVSRLKLWPHFKYIDYNNSAIAIVYDQCTENKAQFAIQQMTGLPHGAFTARQMSVASSMKSHISRPLSVRTNVSLFSNGTQSDIESRASIRSSLTHTSEYDFVETIYDPANLNKSLTSNKGERPIKGPDELGYKTNDEIEHLPRDVSEISNVENKLQMLAKQGWVKRLICNGRYIRVWYDAMDEINAKRLVAELLGIDTKHFDCEYV